MIFIKNNILQIIYSFFFFIFTGFPFIAFAQTTYIPLGDKQYDLLNRLEIKTDLPNIFFSAIKPYSRRDAVKDVELIDSLFAANDDDETLTDIDKYNMQNLLMNNSEWSKPSDYYLSKKPVFGKNGIYKTKDNLLEVNNNDVFLAVNPVLYFTVGKEKSNSKIIYQNTRGVNVRGMIDKKIGFYALVTDNQERDPAYVMNYIQKNNAVPGVGNFKQKAYNTRNAIDYLNATGYATWSVTKFIDMQLGFDKNFIGDGYRSLLLSDFSNNATFLKINTRLGKFNYENLFMELYQPHFFHAGANVLPRKYARFTDLSFNATNWLNVGVFEGLIFARTDHYPYQYFIPIIFTRYGNSQPGFDDNQLIGLHAKANIAHTVQLYGQLALENLSGLFKSNGYWGNQNGIQLGIKYPDALGLKNIDVQLEVNQVRPYTYQHSDSITNYTHYNQPLADPLGANFREFIAIAKYQPIEKLRLEGQILYYRQGLDSVVNGNVINYGANPLENFDTRPADNGFQIWDGRKSSCLLVSGVVSYELKENMFIEATGYYRRFKEANTQQQNPLGATLSFRWNISRRYFNF
ncbi:MAG: hypothetical protein ACR2FN_01140 [Chitinophagaceae bacterium]